MYIMYVYVIMYNVCTYMQSIINIIHIYILTISSTLTNIPVLCSNTTLDIADEDTHNLMDNLSLKWVAVIFSRNMHW